MSELDQALAKLGQPLEELATEACSQCDGAPCEVQADCRVCGGIGKVNKEARSTDVETRGGEQT